MATIEKQVGDGKAFAEASDVEVPNFDANDLPQEKKGTRDDQRDMFRMGKLQEMKRNFRFLSILGFSMTLMCT